LGGGGERERERDRKINVLTFEKEKKFSKEDWAKQNNKEINFHKERSLVCETFLHNLRLNVGLTGMREIKRTQHFDWEMSWKVATCRTKTTM
jgi:hypothetical protein